MTPTTQSRDVILREEDFAPLLQTASADLGGWLRAVLEDESLLSFAPAMMHLSEEANSFETFLDDHGAGSNLTYATLRELVASVRGLVQVKVFALHLTKRLPRYETQIANDALVEALGEAHTLLDRSVLAVLGATVAEIAGFGVSWAPRPVSIQDDLIQRRLLPRNLDLEEVADEHKRIAEIGTKYLKVLDGARNLDLEREHDPASLGRLVSERATEERCRFYESAVHNIQSMYDTYVLDTAIERDNPWLRVLRGHASVALHLLEMATGLVHFYERHENDIRHENARQTISAVVSKDDILHVVVNVCLRQAYLYIEAASDLANRTIAHFVPAESLRLPLPSGVTLHARPLALIVQVIRHHGTPVEITIESERCSGDSLMSLIMLAGSHPQPDFIEFSGDSRALADLRVLFSSGLGENGHALPAELPYLSIAS